MRSNRNAGFSLIEVIVSMAILAIISIPLLNYFTESMKYNGMMAEKQKATLLSQEILEQLQAEERLIQKMPSGDYSIPYLTDRMYTVEANSIDASGTGTIRLTGLADDIGKTYDAVVTAEIDGAVFGGGKASVYGVDSVRDVFAVESSQLQEALVYFTAVNRAYCAANTGAVKLTKDEICSKLTRDIIIDLGADGTGYRVSVKYAYSCAGLKGNPGETVTYDGLCLEDRCMDEVRNIYLLYNRVQQTDRVVINKAAGVLISPDLYLVCQDQGTPPYEVKLANRSNLGVVYTNVEAGHVWDDGGYLITDTKPLSGTVLPDGVIKLQVDVYKKGEAELPGAEPYITINSTRGE